MPKTINVIDLFAGPGGLGEGFSAFEDAKGNKPFKIRMSVENEASAHKTLTTRAFYRLFDPKNLPNAYKQHLAGEISQSELFDRHPAEAKEAMSETLGGPTELGKDNARIFQRIRQLKRGSKDPWIVIGGPPCQAYSLVGRARNKGNKYYKAEEDNRNFLYREYLEVLDAARPDAFVMENVKGILTAKIHGKLLFPTIVSDLKNPTKALGKRGGKKYRIHSFVTERDSDLLDDENLDPRDFVIRSEQHGIPQARHRVFLLGIREGINTKPGQLQIETMVSASDVLRSLPRLRSKLSKEPDSDTAWKAAIKEQAALIAKALKKSSGKNLAKSIRELARKLEQLPTSSSRYRSRKLFPSRGRKPVHDWISENPPEQILNHESRGHIRGDLGRYLFNSAWTKQFGVSAKASDFPEILKPKHKNWRSGDFADRFRVQAENRPSTTVTSHISKDGHYFIHYDPTQCRSLTVREAARLQTFPDNYFFEGNRTQQYVQVGNAVPPLLAKYISAIVHGIIK